METAERSGLIYGKNAVLAYLKSGRPADVLYIANNEDEERYSYFAAMARERQAVVKRVHPLKLEQMCQDRRHQGVALSAPVLEYADVSGMLSAAAAKGEDPFLVAADGIEDPHNLGAVIRAAEAAGAHGLIMAKRGGAPIGTAVQRASAGAVNYLPVARVSNLASALRELKKKGVFAYCADMAGETAFRVDMTGPAVLVIGSEGFGVSRLIKEICDVSVSLPMRGEIGSLNASVAAGALLFEMVRQRMKDR